MVEAEKIKNQKYGHTESSKHIFRYEEFFTFSQHINYYLKVFLIKFYKLG